MSWETCSFLKGNKGAIDQGSGEEGELGGKEGEKAVVRVFCMGEE